MFVSTAPGKLGTAVITRFEFAFVRTAQGMSDQYSPTDLLHSVYKQCVYGWHHLFHKLTTFLKYQNLRVKIYNYFFLYSLETRYHFWVNKTDYFLIRLATTNFSIKTLYHSVSNVVWYLLKFCLKFLAAKTIQRWITGFLMSKELKRMSKQALVA